MVPNAIFRDYTVDHLICCDRRMAMETVQKHYKGQYTQEKIGIVFFL